MENINSSVNNPTENNDIDLDLTKNKQIENLTSLISEVNDLRKDLKDTKGEVNQKIAYQLRCNEQAINSVNTSISGASFALKIFAIIVAISAIGLGIYITRQVRNVTNLTRQNRSIHEMHLKIRDEVKQLDENIKNNLNKLYQDLRKEETKALISRLEIVPKDIANLGQILASRDIPMEFFPKLKEAYKALPPQSESPEAGRYRTSYQLLFFQHFSASALFDEDLQNEMEMNYGVFMEASFENDIRKTSREFIAACATDGILNYREKIKKYFIALGKSRYAEYKELHRTIYETLSTKENRFNFYSILHSEEELGGIVVLYGQYILGDYKDAVGNTDSDKLVLKEIQEEAEPKGDTKR